MGDSPRRALARVDDSHHTDVLSHPGECAPLTRSRLTLIQGRFAALGSEFVSPMKAESTKNLEMGSDATHVFRRPRLQ